MTINTFSVDKWWTYQRERFPIFAHAPLIAAFSFSAVSYSFLLRGERGLPRAGAVIVAFVTSFLFFLQLRIADEFKDFEEDSRYRPYRPVPRGLVSLRELGVIGVAGAAIQLALALRMAPGLIVVLLLTWTYLALMSCEFFAREWLKSRPVTYMWTHMLIMPLIDLYATACDWLVAGAPRPRGVFWFLAVSFFNGMVVEIGRKLRAPEDEEAGVETYTVVWGRTRAVLAWLGVLSMTAICAALAAREIDFVRPVAVLLLALLTAATAISLRFLHRPVRARAKLFEMMAGVWTLLMYLSLGAIPVFVRN
ncbi:MAG: UbiA family prenyltransferase [Blastocatellia bacterium]